MFTSDIKKYEELSGQKKKEKKTNNIKKTV